MLIYSHAMPCRHTLLMIAAATPATPDAVRRRRLLALMLITL